MTPLYLTNVTDSIYIDLDTATVYQETVDGKGASDVTGKDDEHQELIQSRRGFWAIHWWRDDGKFDTVEECPLDSVKAWLERTGRKPIGDAAVGKEV